MKKTYLRPKRRRRRLLGPFLRSSSYGAISIACAFCSCPVLVVALIVRRRRHFGRVVVVVFSVSVPVVVAPPLFRRCILPVFAVPAVSTPRTAARGGGVLVAVVVFASPSLVPAPLPLSSDVALFCRCPDPSSTPRTGARSGGIVVGVPSWRRLVVNNIDKT
jgi:hypothetical protein